MTTDKRVHVVPIDDLKPHVETGQWCHCKPHIKDGVVIHNAYDGREFFEGDLNEKDDYQDITLGTK
jgi:hypothetical protein